MKIKYLFYLFFLISIINANAQVRQSSNIYLAKEFSKDISLFKAKSFLIQEVINTSDKSVQFEATPLAAASSGELTALLYKCESQNKEGLILGFFGDYVNEAGVMYQGYAFKNFNKDQSLEFLNKIESELEENQKFLKEKNDNNNIIFAYDDLEIIIWTTSNGYLMRIYWNGFDSTWEKTSYERSKRRFEKKI